MIQPPAGVDLHAHTTASDGSLSPTELMQLAAGSHLAAIAVTDHDTLDGLPEAEIAANQVGIRLVPGIELSLSVPVGQFHMLGLLVDHRSESLNGRLTHLQQARQLRNELVLEKLRSLGFEISMEEAIAESGGGQLGRPHIAQALIRKGYAQTVQEAFDKWLGYGASCYIDKEVITLEEGIDLIHSAGGKAIMAHPHSLKLDDQNLVDYLKELKNVGLDGLECYYNLYSKERCDQLLSIARELNIKPTGGSDFHGTAKPSVVLGQAYGDRPAPREFLEELITG